MPTNAGLDMTKNFNCLSHFEFYLLCWLHSQLRTQPLHISSNFTEEITKLQFFSFSFYRFFKRCERISTRQDTKREQFANISYAFTIRCLIVDWLHQLKRIVALNSMSLVCARFGLCCALYIQLRNEHCI